MYRELFGLRFDAVTLRQASNKIIHNLKSVRKRIVITPNVDHIVRIEKDPELKEIYTNSHYLFADGMPIVWLSRLVPGSSLPERVTGVDLLFDLVTKSEKLGLSVMFMGGGEGVAEQAARNLAKSYPSLKVAGTYFPKYGFENDTNETNRMIECCNKCRPDILFFGVGSPKQEKWITKYIENLDVGVVLCIGAAIDFAAEKISRAPVFLQKIGLEWLWRFLQEPKRLWKRYFLQDSIFVFLALKELVKQWRSALRVDSKNL